MLKTLGILALLLVGCVRAPIIEAPTVIRVENVEAESLTDEPPYVPTVKWKVESSTESYNAGEAWNADDRIDGYRIPNGAVYNWGGVKATVSTEGADRIRLDCSTGGAGIFLCLADEATMTASCERMWFKFTCSKR